jgi:hypothetical protein
MKGIIGLLIGSIVFLIFYIYVITTLIGNSTFLKRNVAENNVLLIGSKIETYAKSFLQALKLSLLKAIYDAGENDNNIWQCYSRDFWNIPPISESKEKYGNCLGDAYSSSFQNSEINSKCGWNKILDEILSHTNSYANSYLSAYSNFPKNTKPKVNFPSSLSNPFMGVKFYNGIDYTGEYSIIQSGKIDLSKINGPCNGNWANCISSFKLSPGCNVTLYKDSISNTFSSDKPNLSSVCIIDKNNECTGEYWDNKANFIEVDCGDFISVRWEDISLISGDDKIIINKTFIPEAKINVTLYQMHKATYNLISENMIEKNVFLPAIQEALPFVSCQKSIYGNLDCSSSAYKINHCTSYPSAEDVFQSSYGISIDEAKNNMRNNINNKLNQLASDLSANKQYTIKFSANVNSFIYPYDDKVDEIDGGYCVKTYGKDDSCRKCSCSDFNNNKEACISHSCSYDSASNLCSGEYNCGEWYKTECTFKYYSTINSKVDVMSKEEYVSWKNNAAKDSLHLKYTIIYGNTLHLKDTITPNLSPEHRAMYLDCSVYK